MVKKECEGFSHPALQTDARFLPPTISSYVIKVCIYICHIRNTCMCIHTYTCMCICTYIYICFFGSFYLCTYIYIYSCDSNGFNYWTVFFKPFLNSPSSYVTWWVTSKEGAQSIPWIKNIVLPIEFAIFWTSCLGHMFCQLYFILHFPPYYTICITAKKMVLVYPRKLSP